MVISFSVKEAREQLLNEGVVYTYRWTRRAFFAKEKGEIEQTWANKKRGLSRIAYVKIEEIGELPCGPSLRPYAEKSGFKNVCGWQRKILEQANPHGFINGWLYKVTLHEYWVDVRFVVRANGEGDAASKVHDFVPDVEADGSIIMWTLADSLVARIPSSSRKET